MKKRSACHHLLRKQRSHRTHSRQAAIFARLRKHCARLASCSDTISGVRRGLKRVIKLIASELHSRRPCSRCEPGDATPQPTCFSLRETLRGPVARKRAARSCSPDVRVHQAGRRLEAVQNRAAQVVYPVRAVRERFEALHRDRSLARKGDPGTSVIVSGVAVVARLVAGGGQPLTAFRTSALHSAPLNGYRWWDHEH